jgi:hypothetical protein
MQAVLGMIPLPSNVECPVCYEGLSYPVFVCPGHTDQQVIHAWRQTAPDQRASIPTTWHQAHVACMRRWKLECKQHDASWRCPTCRGNLAEVAFKIQLDGTIDDMSSSSSEASAASESGSGESFYRMTAEHAGLVALQFQEKERAWIQCCQRQDGAGWHACCNTGFRCWVPASDMLQQLQENGRWQTSVDVLLRELQDDSYSWDRAERPLLRAGQPELDYEYGRPVFEIFWDPSDMKVYVSCFSVLSDHRSCTCGALNRDADLRYVQWDEFIWANVHHHMQWACVNLLSECEMWPFDDEAAGRGELTAPWMLASAVVRQLHEHCVVENEFSVHEFVWQCRRYVDMQQRPQVLVCTYCDDRGWCDYWVRLTTIGWRRRLAERQDLIEV